MKNLKDELQARGLIDISSVTDISEITEGQKRTLYIGIDPTGDSLHIGHLLQFVLARHFLTFGHKVIVLIGGATGMIGDPSGKSEERILLDEDTLLKNSKSICNQISSIFNKTEFDLVNNSDWISDLKFVSFLRDVGKHFTVGALLQKESVKTRLESGNGISYTEFSYSLIQSYDYYHLYKNHGCTLQIGGSDQWGNISTGIDFVRRKTSDKVFGLASPLVVDKDGRKLGKTAPGGAVWLDSQKTSPYKFYQFWLNVDDEIVCKYLRLFTFVPVSEIDQIEKSHKISPQNRLAQLTLAQEMTSMLHGEEKSQTVKRVSELLFGSTEFYNLSADEQNILADEISTVNVSKSEVEIGVPLVDVLTRSGLASSKTEAGRLIKEGSISLNNTKKTVQDAVVSMGDFAGRILLLKKGKKNFACVKIK